MVCKEAGVEKSGSFGCLAEDYPERQQTAPGEHSNNAC